MFLNLSEQLTMLRGNPYSLSWNSIRDYVEVLSVCECVSRCVSVEFAWVWVGARCIFCVPALSRCILNKCPDRYPRAWKENRGALIKCLILTGLRARSTAGQLFYDQSVPSFSWFLLTTHSHGLLYTWLSERARDCQSVLPYARFTYAHNIAGWKQFCLCA